MAEILTEAPIALAVSAWKKQHGGEKPDINSEEFKAFKKQVDKEYNYKQQQKADNDNNVGVFVDKLYDIIQQKPEAFPQEFYNALTNLQKKGKVNLCNELLRTVELPGEAKIWVQVIGNLYNTNKNESAEITLEAMKESSKYPWISGLLNHRLMKEDDFNLDSFDASVAGAGGMNISSDSSSTDSTETDTSTTDSNFNLDDMNGGDLHITPAGGAIDSIGMGGGLDDMPASQPVDPNAPVYRVIDVIFDDEDPETAPKVKVQNVKTGETEIKDIFAIDV